MRPDIPVVTQLVVCPNCGEQGELEDANKYETVICWCCGHEYLRPDPKYFSWHLGEA